MFNAAQTRSLSFEALSKLDAELARGQAAVGIVRQPVPTVPAWFFDALVADLAEVRDGSASLNHDRFGDQ